MRQKKNYIYAYVAMNPPKAFGDAHTSKFLLGFKFLGAFSWLNC